MDEGSPVDVIYLDFQKAFDKVPHQRLLLKDDKTEENTFEILQHSDRNINNS